MECGILQTETVPSFIEQHENSVGSGLIQRKSGHVLIAANFEDNLNSITARSALSVATSRVFHVNEGDDSTHDTKHCAFRDV